jgi:chromosome partitioning protein
MGLFNRGSRSEPDRPSRPEPDWEWEATPDAPASNGHRADPWEAEPAPPEPEVKDAPPELSTPSEPPAAAEPPAAEPPAAPELTDAASEPTATPDRSALAPEPRTDEPARAPSPPPANRAEVDPDDAGRLTPQQALAPSRGPATLITPSGGAEAPERRAQVISFANQKGGVAKTTTTLNLAVAFAESGHDVLAVDLDPQGNLTMSQGIDPDRVERSMYDVLVHHIPIREVIQEREIDIAVASIDLAGAEIAMSTQIGRERSLEKALSAVADDYDFVCIDTPPSLGLLTVNALTASDKVIVPVQCEYLSMRGLVQLQNTLEMIRENLNPRVHIEGILPTMLDSRTVHAKEAVEILEENFGELVFKSRIRKAIKFAEAPVRGSSVLKYDPKGNAANYYRELAKEVLEDGAA